MDQQVSNKTNKETVLSSKRSPFCSRCRNHGVRAYVKGHKRHCEFRNCLCEGCGLVHQRQIISARQIKYRRDQMQDEQCGRRPDVRPPLLTRATSSDSASVLAKYLLQKSLRSSTPSSTSSHLRLHESNHHTHLDPSQHQQPQHQQFAAAHRAAPAASPSTYSVHQHSLNSHLAKLHSASAASSIRSNGTSVQVSDHLTTHMAPHQPVPPAYSAHTNQVSQAYHNPSSAVSLLLDQTNGLAAASSAPVNPLAQTSNHMTSHLGLHPTLSSSYSTHTNQTWSGPQAYHTPVSAAGLLMSSAASSAVSPASHRMSIPYLNLNPLISSHHTLTSSSPSLGSIPSSIPSHSLFNFPNSMFNAAAVAAAAAAAQSAPTSNTNQPPSETQRSQGSSHLNMNLNSMMFINKNGVDQSSVNSASSTSPSDPASISDNSPPSSMSYSSRSRRASESIGFKGLRDTSDSTGTRVDLSLDSSSHLSDALRQIKRVDQIHQTCGRLAVFAWLKSEQFNEKKIRTIIESSRLPFNDLLQTAGHSPLDLTYPISDNESQSSDRQQQEHRSKQQNP